MDDEEPFHVLLVLSVEDLKYKKNKSNMGEKKCERSKSKIWQGKAIASATKESKHLIHKLEPSEWRLVVRANVCVEVHNRVISFD